MPMVQESHISTQLASRWFRVGHGHLMSALLLCVTDSIAVLARLDGFKNVQGVHQVVRIVTPHAR
jgi:hypothetical protein